MSLMRQTHLCPCFWRLRQSRAELKHSPAAAKEEETRNGEELPSSIEKEKRKGRERKGEEEKKKEKGKREV